MVQESMTSEAAIVGILVAAVRADGQEVRSELREATLHLERLEPEVRVTPAAAQALVAAATKAISAVGVDAHVLACASFVPSALRLRVFLAAIEVAAADGHAAGAERAFLDRLAKALALDEDESRSAVTARLG